LPAPKKGKRFGKSASHQRLMLANLAGAPDRGRGHYHTESKAKALRPYVEKLVTKAKVGGVHKQRQVVATITTRTSRTSCSSTSGRATPIATAATRGS